MNIASCHIESSGSMDYDLVLRTIRMCESLGVGGSKIGYYSHSITKVINVKQITVNAFFKYYLVMMESTLYEKCLSCMYLLDAGFIDSFSKELLLGVLKGIDYDEDIDYFYKACNALRLFSACLVEQSIHHTSSSNFFNDSTSLLDTTAVMKEVYYYVCEEDYLAHREYMSMLGWFEGKYNPRYNIGTEINPKFIIIQEYHKHK